MSTVKEVLRKMQHFTSRTEEDLDWPISNEQKYEHIGFHCSVEKTIIAFDLIKLSC